MKSILLTSSALFLLTVSCSDHSEKRILSVEKKIVYENAGPVAANRQLAVEVMGMSCEHACGGTIRTALKDTKAVDRCSFDFKPDRKVNTAFITFDKDKISADQIVSIIQKLNDGQFTTGKTATTSLEAPAAEPEKTTKTTIFRKTSTDSAEALEVSSTSFEFPNLFELLSSFVS
jgi:copper chaperone CopZ